MTAADEPLGRIVTFYSYKGGTGRSMAVANVAWILASNGYKVLAIDWDLEAPGLHRYFRPFLRDPALVASAGLIDCFIEFADAALVDTKERTDADWFRGYADLRMFATALDWPHFDTPGRLDFVGAGRQDLGYSTRVNSFNWSHFYTKLGGGVFLEEMKRQLRADYDYVLIDSRTGVSDTSGICTVQMPDRLVVCFTLNEQSISGAASTAASAAQQRTSPTGAKMLRVMPVATRVDQGEKERADGARAEARERFDRLLDWLDDDQIAEYWAAVETPYLPFYGFEEVLAVFGDSPAQRSSMLAAMEGLAFWISDKDVRQLPPIEESLRTATLAKFLRSRPKPAAAEPSRDRYMFYVCYADKDRDGQLARFVDDLRYEVAALSGLPEKSVAYYDRVSLLAGDDWGTQTRAAFTRSDTLLLLDSPTSRRSQSVLAQCRTAASTAKPIVVADWIPVEGEADAFQQFRPSGLARTPGFRKLYRDKDSDKSYAEAIEHLARDLIAASQRKPAPRPDETPEILVAVLAQRKGEDGKAGPSKYGLRRRDWTPFAAEAISVDNLVKAAASPSIPPLRFVSLHKLDAWLKRTPRKATQAAVLLFDPASIHSRDAINWLSLWAQVARAPLAFMVCDEEQRFVPAVLPLVAAGVAAGTAAVAGDVTSFTRVLQELAAQLPGVAAKLYEERKAWHPEDDMERRGELTPCSFTIPKDWQRRSAKRWLEWGDVLVELADPPNSDLTFLLPSARTPDKLRAPKGLKEEGGLKRKQKLTEQFAEKHLGHTLDGYWFYRRMSDEVRRVQIYCAQYDEFLSVGL